MSQSVRSHYLHSCAPRQPQRSRLAGIAAGACIALGLGGCAMKMPSFGFGKDNDSTASLTKDRYAMGSSGAAYDRSGQSNRPVPYRPAPLRPARRASPWVWSGRGQETEIITVRRGESLYGIASRRNVAISELMAANRLSGPQVTPGQQLLVPVRRDQRSDTRVTNRNSAIRATNGAYDRGDMDLRYRRGDQRDTIVRNERGSNDRDPPRLFERSVSVPRSTSIFRGDERRDRRSAVRYKPERSRIAEVGQTRRARNGRYQVQPGDTLYAIARAMGVSPRQLARHNNLTDPSRLRVGMILDIPR